MRESEEVRNNIMGLFHPLLPPPQRIVDVVRPAPILPSSSIGGDWWSQPSISNPLPAYVEAWRIVPSSPSTTSSTDSNSLWSSMGLNETQLPSPTESYSLPYSNAGLFFSAPQVSSTISPLPLPN